jgi:hypothetical protein
VPETVVCPTAKRLPDGGAALTPTGASPPAVEKLNVMAIGFPVADRVVWFGGHVIVSGAAVTGTNVTVTMKLQLTSCPVVEDATATTVVGPTANRPPDTGVDVTVTGPTAPVTMAAG